MERLPRNITILLMLMVGGTILFFVALPTFGFPGGFQFGLDLILICFPVLLGYVGMAASFAARLEPLKPLLDVVRFRERVTELLQLAETDTADRAVLERFQAAPERNPLRPDD